MAFNFTMRCTISVVPVKVNPNTTLLKIKLDALL